MSRWPLWAPQTGVATSEIDEIVATFSRQFEAWVEAWGTVNYCKLRGSKTVRRRFGLCAQPWFTDPPKNMRLAHGRSQLSLFHMFHRHISSYPLLIHDPWPSLATPQTKDPNGKASPVVSLAPGHRPRTHEGEPRAAMPPLVVEQLCVIMGRGTIWKIVWTINQIQSAPGVAEHPLVSCCGYTMLHPCLILVSIRWPGDWLGELSEEGMRDP